MALLWAHLDEVGGGLAPKTPGGAATSLLVHKDWHFYRSMSVGPQGDEFLAPGADRDGIGKAELPFQFVVGVSCLQAPHGHSEGFFYD